MESRAHLVFVRRGDARAELEALLREIGAATAADAGLHKLIHVTRADQTVVMVTGAESPLARALRGRNGWDEPAP